MRYSEFIDVNRGFQSSVNLEFDLNDIDKIRSYIPTEQSVQILGKFLKSYYYASESSNRATILIGPYGRGKSHLLLVLSALTSLDLRAKNPEEKKRAQDVQQELCNKISSVNKEVGSLARAIVDSDIRTLPVIVNSNSIDINQSFLIAINDALMQAGLQDLVPTTYFDSALSIISKWHLHYPDAYNELAQQLKKWKITIDDLCIGLKQYSQNSYDIFCKCYPDIAAGTEFNPLTNMDVVKLYLAVVDKLYKETPYKGVTVVFDEFSKFLEANLDKNNMLNFKIIQDMAEAATRSNDAQLHLTCITHKDILDYSSSESFKAVEGRFKKILFVSSSEQNYELIANAIIKKDSFGQFEKEHSRDFQKLATISSIVNVFNDLSPEAYEQKLIYGCFPLNPLCAFSLLRVSELVGQNERTLFTFLAEEGPSTLRSFLEIDHEEFKTLTIEYIYDYFEDLFRRETFNTSVHSIWQKTDSALLLVEDSIQQNILKAIAIINMIGDERFRAIPAHIKSALMLSDETFEIAIRQLLRNHILAQRDSSELILLTSNGVNVQISVDNYVKSKMSRINECAVLQNAYELGYVLPRAYNDKYGIMRYFKNIYMNASVFIQYKSANQVLSDYPYDGIVIYIICSEKELETKVIQKIKTFTGSPQIVLCMSKLSFTYDLLLKKYQAAIYLLEDNKTSSDIHFMEELEIYKEDLQKQIITAVYILYSPSSEYSYYLNCNGELSVRRQKELNQEISIVCSECYNLSPVINNEMVNKKRLSPQITKARNKVSDWILQHSEDAVIPCMPGFGPEVSIFKSAFKYKGLDSSPITNDSGMNEVLEKISNFLSSCENNRKDIGSLYLELTSPPYGLRKGIIPLYISYVMRQYKECIILYFKGKEIELSADTLSNLNDNPSDYQLLLESGTSERVEFLDALQELYGQYIDEDSKSINRIYSIVKSMQNWIRSLPEYTRRFNYYWEEGEKKTVSSSVVIIRNDLMKFEINARELLFDKWIPKFSNNGDYKESLFVIKTVKNQLDSHLKQFRSELTMKVTDMFKPGYKGGLSHAVMSWYENLRENTRKHMFDSKSNALLSVAGSTLDYDDSHMLNKLVSIFSAIDIEDWNDYLANNFIEELQKSIAIINDYTESHSQSRTETDGKLSVLLKGNIYEKEFTLNSITPLGKTAYNNIKSVLEEYNESLGPEEQVAILAKIIMEIS